MFYMLDDETNMKATVIFKLLNKQDIDYNWLIEFRAGNLPLKLEQFEVEKLKSAGIKIKVVDKKTAKTKIVKFWQAKINYYLSMLNNAARNIEKYSK